MSNTNNFGTAINTAFYTTTSALNTGAPLERTIQRFVGSNLLTKLSVQSVLSDNIITNNAGTTFAINHANTIYVWITLQNVSAADSTTISLVQITD
jgi:hypothetical protein